MQIVATCSPERWCDVERSIILADWEIELAKAGKLVRVRRVIVPQPFGVNACTGGINGFGEHIFYPTKDDEAAYSKDDGLRRCPYQVGDVLWVKETWQYGDENRIVYRADGTKLLEWQVWYSPVHMLRTASRFAYEITGERIERLHDITDADICAELGYLLEYPGPGPEPYKRSLRWAYIFHWDDHHKKERRWAMNPWTWVLTLKAVEVPS